MTSRLNLAALALLLAAAPARALNKGYVGSHQHDAANHGGSTLRPVVLSVSGLTTLSTATITGSLSVSSGTTLAGGATVQQVLNIPAGSSISMQGYAPDFDGVRVATAALTGASSYTFSGLVSSATYRLYWNVVQVTSAGGYHLRFNGDTGANYVSVLHELFSNGSTSSEQATTYCSLTDTVTEVPKVGKGSRGHINFSTVPTLVAQRTSYGAASWTENSVSLQAEAVTGCTHNGSGQLTSATFTVTAGTVTGYLTLYRLVDN